MRHIHNNNCLSNALYKYENIILMISKCFVILICFNVNYFGLICYKKTPKTILSQCRTLVTHFQTPIQIRASLYVGVVV